MGTLNSENRNQNYAESYEGPGLSVSLHPDDWRAIAKLGDTPTWVAHKTNNLFVDRWALTEQQEDEIQRWGIRNQLLEYVTRWEVARWDSELDHQYFIHCETYQEALEEADMEESIVTEIETLASTTKLAELTGTQKGNTASAFDMALNIYTQQETDLDGIWWEDTYDPSTYSCPRGVILPDMIFSWSFTAINGTHKNSQHESRSKTILCQDLKVVIAFLTA